MSLFSCCPKKPKKSLDYVIKWVEDTDKIIKDLSDTVQELNNWKEGISEETLKPIFDEYAETYPWDSVPAFNEKADKVENAVQGNFAGLDENGNLIDSDYAPSDFAPADHSHSSISHRKDNKLATIYGYCDAYTSPYFGISLVNEIGNPQSAKSVNLNMNNIDNLARALNTPDNTPTAGSDNLVTSGGVKAALDAKYSINQVDENDEQEAHLLAIAEDDDIYFDFRLNNGNTQKEVLLPISKMDNFARAISNPDTTPEEDSDNLITSGAVYNSISKQAHLTIFKDADHYPVDTEYDVKRDLSNFLSNFESNKLYNCIITYRTRTPDTQITDGFAGTCKWVFNGYDEHLDETIWTVYLYLGLTTFLTRCRVQGEVTVWDMDSWADWSYTSIKLE